MKTGAVIYEGPSQLDGKPIACIATGIEGNSMNHKTGPMIQTWIIRSDVPPNDAVTTGDDASVCGTCPLRGVTQTIANGEKVNRFRGCYVFVGQAPTRIFNSYRAMQYERGMPASRIAGLAIRFGAYGDPCAVPIEIWEVLSREAKLWTGYTHQWRDDRFQDYQKLLMASVESEAEAIEARGMGWRTFRVAVTGTPPAAGEFHCPASSEEGYRKTCEECLACDGVNGRGQRASVIIWPHGPPASVKSFYRTVRGDSKEIDHRKALTAFDVEVLVILKRIGPASAATIAERTARGTQGIATRIWHLRQMGFVKKVGRGLYEAIEVANVETQKTRQRHSGSA